NVDNKFNDLATKGSTTSDTSGNSSQTTAQGTTVKDKDNNTNQSTATANQLADNKGNTNTSTAGSNTLTDGTHTTTTTPTGTTYGYTDASNKSGTVVGQDGLTIKKADGTDGASITSKGIDAGNQQVKNVASAGDITQASNANNAVNAGDLNTQVTNLTNSGLNFGGDAGDTVHRNLGQQLNIQGGADTTALTDKNIGVVTDKNTGSLNVKLAKDINLGTTGSVTTGNTVVTNTGVTVDDKQGNSSELTVSGTTVKDASKNTATYGSTSTEYKDQNGKVISSVGKDGLAIAGGPSITANGIDAANQKISNLQTGSIADGSTDAVTGGQVAKIQESISGQIGSLNNGAVQYAKKADGSVNYDSIIAGNGKGTALTTGTDQYGNEIVTGGGTTISNVANAKTASDAVNKGQLDSAISNNITNVSAGGKTVNVTDQVVNQNYGKTDPNSLFLTYDKSGQTTTDQLTIGQTVKKMNTEGVKFAHTNSTDSTALDSSAGGVNSTALGVNAIANGNSSVALGNNSIVSGSSSVAIGDSATASGDQSISIGAQAKDQNGKVTNSVASGKQSISIGTGNQVTGNNSGAFGDPSTITGNESYVLGNNNTVNTDNTFVVGNNVKTTTAGSVVLGNSSAASTGAGVSGYVPTGATASDQSAINATISTTGAVAVGDAQSGIYRQITGVAAGTSDSDAVNVAQLKAVDNKVLALKTSGNTITQGINSNVSNAQGNTVTDGTNSNTSTAGSNTITDGNNNTAATTATGTTYTNADKSSATVGGTGLSFKDASGNPTGPSVTASGISAGNEKVTNVADGTVASGSKDVVNGGQLNTSNENLASALGGGASYKDGSYKAPTYAISRVGTATPTTVNNVGDALTALSTDVVKPITFNGNTGSSSNQLGSSLNISGGSTADSSNSNVKTVVTGNTVDIQLANAPTFTGVVTANGFNANNNKVTNVKNGDVNSTSTDAVNGSQLNALQTDVDSKFNDLGTKGSNTSDASGNSSQTTAQGTTVTDAANNINQSTATANQLADNKGNTNTSTAGSNKITDGNNNTAVTTATGTTYTNADKSSTTVGGTGLSFKDASSNPTGPSVTASGISAGNEKVTNVADGTVASGSKDAVNGGQVSNISNSIANAIGGVTVNQNGTISSPTYNIAGATQNNISDALNALNTAVQQANTTGKDINVSQVNVADTSGNSVTTTSKGVSVIDSAGNGANYSAQNMSLTDGSGNKVTTTAGGTTYGYADASNKAGTVVNQNGLSFTDSSGHQTGPSVTASGIDAGGKAITGVAAGVNATDAVNKGQLDSAVNTVSNNVNNLSNAAVQYDKNADGSVNKGRVSLGDGKNPTTLTNVADGVVAAGSKDAVNGGQLANVQSQVTANTNSINSLNSSVSDLASGKSGAVQQADKNGDISIGKDTGGTKVNVANSTGATRTITGVSAGNVTSASSTDAVNGGQLYQSNAAIAAALGGNAQVQSNGTVSTSNIGGTGQSTIDGAVGNLNGRVGNLESAFVQTNQQLNKFRNETNAGIAGAMAVGNLPQPSEAGMSMVSAGIGGYRGEGAVSVGVSAITDSNKYIWKFGASADTRSNVSGAVSVGYQWK
ncbi:YadA-like family protein, partial [Acinetobacter nectaris]